MKTRIAERSKRSNAPKRAGILIRVSSAEQGKPDKASPETQERDCREHCSQQGHVVVVVYYDIDKYRDAKGRLVEPSGTRSDRPGLKQALADIDAGKIDVLVGWRQDRLVRGITRALIELKERVSSGKVLIELAKEQFNLATFEVLAWAAGVELQAKHDRFMMGVAGRLAKGKVSNIRNPLGYKVIDGKFTIVPEEAKWVSQIWKWFGDGMTGNEIRKRLLAAGAPQRMKKRKYEWPLYYIRFLVNKGHDYYHTGIFEVNWDGEVYEIEIPTIVDAETARKVEERHKNYKRYPAGNIKVQALVAGIVYCKACNVRMRAMRQTTRGSSGRKFTYSFYRCNDRGDGLGLPGCAALVRTNRVDNEVWEKIWKLISQPERFKQSIEDRITQLEAQEIDAEEESKNLQHNLEKMLIQRQQVITWAREDKITETDMETQLKAMDAERAELERELGEKSLLVRGKAGQLRELADLYRDEVMMGAENINKEPQTLEEAALQFEARRKIVQRLVIRVDVKEDKSTEVLTEIGPAHSRIMNTTTHHSPRSTYAHQSNASPPPRANCAQSNDEFLANARSASFRVVNAYGSHAAASRIRR